jgi:ABC-type nickel/cobalt efflux system permease component RcnA
MIGVLSIIALGFFLGMRHATDPDHVIAVTTIVSRERSIGAAAWIGALWGLGHTITIFAVGAGIILVGWVIPTRLGLSMEFSVGLMLILLGILNLTGMLQWVNDQFLTSSPGSPSVHSHPHSHGGHVHTHPHVHSPESHSHSTENTSLGFLDRAFGKLGVYQVLRPLVVGLVHGLAGSAAVALLVLTTIRQPRWAVAYLLVFGIGTIAGMMLITAAIAVPFTYASNRFTNLNRTLRIATGLLSLAFGLFLTYQIGIVHGLFSSHPQWTPQ